MNNAATSYDRKANVYHLKDEYKKQIPVVLAVSDQILIMTKKDKLTRREAKRSICKLNKDLCDYN